MSGRRRWAWAPNALSAARLLLLAPAFAVLVADDHRLAAAAVLVVLAATDWADGALARRTGTTSRTGEVLDPVADRLGLLVVVTALVVTGAAPVWLVPVLAVPDLVLAAAVLRVLSATGRPPAVRVVAVGRTRTAVLFLAALLLVLASGSAGGEGLDGAATTVAAAGATAHVAAAAVYVRDVRRGDLGPAATVSGGAGPRGRARRSAPG